MARRDPSSVARINVFDEVRKARTDAARTDRHGRPRGKLRSDIPGTDKLTREPPLTPAIAAEFIKLLHAGIPQSKILSYFAPAHFASLSEKERRLWMDRWANSSLMAAAASTFNKGAWQDLDKDSRITLALDKHMAELAYFLYTTNYTKAEGYQYKKIIDARTALMEFTKDSDGSSDTPFMRAMRDLIAGKIDGQAPLPTSPPRISADDSLGQSIPSERVKKVLES